MALDQTHNLARSISSLQGAKPFLISWSGRPAPTSAKSNEKHHKCNSHGTLNYHPWSSNCQSPIQDWSCEVLTGDAVGKSIKGCCSARCSADTPWPSDSQVSQAVGASAGEGTKLHQLHQGSWQIKVNSTGESNRFEEWLDMMSCTAVQWCCWRHCGKSLFTLVYIHNPPCQVPASRWGNEMIQEKPATDQAEHLNLVISANASNVLSKVRRLALKDCQLTVQSQLSTKRTDQKKQNQSQYTRSRSLSKTATNSQIHWPPSGNRNSDNASDRPESSAMELPMYRWKTGRPLSFGLYGTPDHCR